MNSQQPHALTQADLFLPLVSTVVDLGGAAKPKEVYPALAERLGVPDQVREATKVIDGRTVRLFDRDVRWARQKAVLAGFFRSDTTNLWEVTEEGRSALVNARPGAIVTVFESEAGVCLWAEASTAVRSIEDEIVQLIVTSPAYPLLRKKDYANQHAEQEHVDWLVSEIAPWRRVMAPDGSLVLNLGETWTPGEPVQTLYGERLLLRLCDQLGLHLAQRLYWHNPAKVPGPAEWVNIRRVRVTPSVEQLYWLSKSGHPKANNRNVLRPYSESMKGLLARGGMVASSRPSGHQMAAGAFSRDNGGSVAQSLLTIPHTASRSGYFEYCRTRGLPVHPARFPEELAEWLIKFMTDEGDVVWDPYGGSLTTLRVGTRLGRRVISGDKALDYLQGGVCGRFGPEEGRRSPVLEADLAGFRAQPALL